MRKKIPGRRYDIPIQVRVTGELHDLYLKAAEYAGLSLSGWMRDRLARVAREELGETPKSKE